MAGISSPGLGSGLDVNGIISQLMAIEQRPLTALAQKEASFQAKITAYGSAKGALSSLQTALASLADGSKFTAFTTAFSESGYGIAAASITNDGTGNRLVLTSKDTGVANLIFAWRKQPDVERTLPARAGFSARREQFTEHRRPPFPHAFM